MIVSRGKKNKNLSRPRKTGAKLRRRLLEHRRRIFDLGFSEQQIKSFTRKDMLALLKNPKKAVGLLKK